MKIILASSSQRRKELMEMMELKFDVKVSNADETFEENLNIEEQSKRLAFIKAKAVYDEVKDNNEDVAVIGSDTMVLFKDKIYGKPHTREEAIKMLRDLSNNKHTVITSICVLSNKNSKYKEQIDYDVTDVYFKKMSDEEIANWVDTGNVYDKAGAYAVQSKFGVHIEKINGNYFSVMGLPVHKLYDMLKNI